MKKITLLFALLLFGFMIQNSHAQITSFPYSEDFESGDGGWVANNTTNGTWALGTPAGTVINSAASGSNAWATNLTGNYNNNENSFVQSPVFDFSTLNAPGIQFSLWWNTEFSWDGLVLQSSIDGGTSWQNVGAFNDPNNWYNDNTINGNPGGQQIGWSGRISQSNGSGGWVSASNALAGLGGQSNVILRFAFGSDGSVNDNGVAFDLVNIFDVTCPAPTTLNAAVNVTDATLSWTAGGTESAWEYINQLSGNPAPTSSDSGTPVGTNSVDLFGLTEGATYQFYVRADCGGDLSVWSGPFTYSISGPGETCGNPIVVPPLLPFSTDDDTANYGDDLNGAPGANCGTTSPYLGGDDVVYSYTPDNDMSITITLTPLGTWSGLFVYNSCADIGSACIDGVANSAVGIREIVLPVTAGNTIYIVISTWPAPQSVAYNLTITENTCTDPEATFSVVSDCINGEQFFIDVDVTSLGSANTLSLADNQGNPPLSVDAIGVFSFGPYANTTNVAITVSNDDDANCVVGGPTLTQEFCLDAIVDCTAGPVNVSYCYINSDTNVFLYTSSDGSPLTLTINSGFVENNWDELIILDSDGITNLNAATPYGAAGNIASLTFQSSGDSISFWVQADGVISCASGSTPMNTGIDYTVACATCTNPVASFALVSDCLNAPQFFVEVDVTDIGSAASLTLTDNQGSDAQTANAAGTFTFGPYANLTPVVISIANDDDSNCVVNSNSLTQEFCIENSVNCEVGPISAFYCYGNNDTNVFQYTSSDGSPLNLVINSGNVENNWDELIILDSDGITNLNAATPYGNAGNIAGLTFQSTGDTIFFAVESDFTVSCASSGAPLNLGINYTVSCATCINPQAAFQVVDDCANGDQFLVDVNITSLGDAISVSISDNQGSTPVSVNATGITQFGPYPFFTDIIFTISNDQDVNCVINSAPIQVLACPPANDNCEGATNAVVNTTDSCDQVTPGTILAATPSGVPVGSCAGNPNDDVWFEFTATSDVQIISLLNITGGTFNLDHAVYEGNCGNLTELYCSPNTASVTPQLVIGNTYYIRVFSFGNVAETTNFDLCIRPAPTNIICENAENFCSDGEALVSSNIIGIPNTGQIACLFTAPNPTWNIIQIGNPGLINLQIVQTNAGGGGLDVDFALWGPFASLEDVCNGLDNGCPNPGDCPNNTANPNFYPFGNIVDCSYSAASIENVTINNAQTGEIYILLVTNFSDQPGEISITQTNAGGGGAGTITAEIEATIESEEVVFFDNDSDPTTPDVAEVCGIETVTIFANSPFADSFIWYKDGFVIEGETGPTLVVTESDNYQVQAFDEQCDTDTFSQIVVIKIYREAFAAQPDDIVTCEETTSTDGIEDFDLNAQIPIILNGQDPDLFVVTFYTSLADANQAINAVSSPFDSAGQTIFVRVEDVNAAADGFLGCRAITQFELIISGPTPTASSVDFEVCDDSSRDGIEIFDLASHDAAILGGQDPNIFNVSYYLTETDANNNVNAIGALFTNTSNPQTIFARVESNVAVDCFSITDFDLIVSDVPFATFNNDVVDFEVCPNATVPIEIGLIPDGFTAADVTIAWELDGATFNEGSGLTIPVLVAGNYGALIRLNDTGCEFFVEATVIELESCVIPQGISPNNDGMNDRFDLSSFNVTRLEIFNRNGTRVFVKDNYRDEWFGQSDNGDTLPVGTYFYTMIYEGGAKKRSSWVYISK